MLLRFKENIAKQHLFSPEQEVLLAVSGGRDSVCLMHLMQQAGYPFAVAHCNFHLRGAESDRDQAFVEHLVHASGHVCHIADFDTTTFATTHHLGIEEAARKQRYEWFASLCRNHGYSAVLTAHHRDDSIETLFLNLFRGTGIAGLHGIRTSSSMLIDNYPLAVVRPLLPFSRADIDNYISEHQLAFVDDHTNFELDARRNRIRHQLMPLLRELYPNIDNTMADNIEHFAETEELLRQYVDHLHDTLFHPYHSPFSSLSFLTASIADLRNLQPQRTALYELLRRYNFPISIVDEILAALPDARTGSRFLSSTHEVIFDRGQLLLAPLCESVPPSLSCNETTPGAVPDFQTETTDGTTEYFDADLIQGLLTVRPWRSGDRFHPLGMQHGKLVSDFLKDSKLNIIEKRAIYLLVDGDDRIMWVIGLRADHRFRITPSTSHVLRVSILTA